MRSKTLKTNLNAASLALIFLLLGAYGAVAQQTINLTAAPTTTTLPDGSVVPMWGYSCGTAVPTATATCAALNPAATTTIPAGWSPVVITVPFNTAGSTSLTINLTNNLIFPVGKSRNSIPTSLVIVGQVGGGLGLGGSYTQSPDHSQAQGSVTWFIANTGGSGTPPIQGQRVQSFGTQVGAGSTTALTWSALRPGTYLLESGTHPSIQVPMGLYGILVVTSAPTGTSHGTAYPAVGTTIPAVTYNAEVPLEFSEIDPVQNNAVNTAVTTLGFVEYATALVSTSTPDALAHCVYGNPATAAAACYPPAVNYTPFYFLINGVAFNKTNQPASLFAATQGTATGTITGTVLVRMVNAGLRMHVPAIVGSQTTGWNGGGTATGSVTGFTLIAEDGNPIPGPLTTGPAPRVQTDVFMAAGKTFDVMVNAQAAGMPALPVYDRELSLSGNSSTRDAGMLAYIGMNSAVLPGAVSAAGNGNGDSNAGAYAKAQANNVHYPIVVACPGTGTCTTVGVSDVSKGVLAKDFNVYGVKVLTTTASGTLKLAENGTFTYTPNNGISSDTFTYCANGTVTAAVCSSGITATVYLDPTTLTGNPIAANISYNAQTGTKLVIPAPGVLSVDTDPNNLPLHVNVASVSPTGVTVTMEANGGFIAMIPAHTNAASVSFTYKAQNSLGALSNTATVTLRFPKPSNLSVKVIDAKAFSACKGSSTCISALPAITDYRWIIEEDKTFYVDPNCTTNTSITQPGCPTIVGPSGQSTIPTFGVNFHTSHMEYVAQGCTGPLSCESGQTVYNPATGTHVPAACDAGDGICDITRMQEAAVDPSQVLLDPTRRYYLSVLPGDAANPFNTGNTGNGCTPTSTTTCPSVGHTMSGAPIPAACNIYTAGCTPASTAAFAPVTVLALPTPLPPGKLSVMVFEDDFPLNGEQDSGGGAGVVSPNEPGLGGFNLVLWDAYGQLGDVTGQMTYDMFNQPLSNSLAGTIDPATGNDACPISANAQSVTTGAGAGASTSTGQLGITGMIVTCPKYESDGKTLSPLAGQAVIANLMQGKFNVQAYPGADRIARGEEWLQTNTLDGQHPHDSFIRIGEPSYFQEYGPAGYHVSIGFANPKIINDRLAGVCAGAFGSVGPCNNTITGQVVDERMSRTPDQRLYPSGSRDALAWTQCWVSLGDPDAEDFMFTKCDANGNFTFTGVPGGNWRITLGDQWNDQIIDGLSTPANVSGGQTLNMGQIAVQQWQSNVYTRTCIDDNKDGICEPNELGIPFLNVHIWYRDGESANMLTTDFNGTANFNETFPLFNWYVVETDSTRYKTTGIHTVYDAGGPADGSTYCGTSTNGNALCGTSTAYNFLANTYERTPLPSDLSVPGAVYCTSADCVGAAGANSFMAGTAVPSSTSNHSTGRIDPPWVWAEGWTGEIGEGNWIEFGKAPYAACPPACATAPVPGTTTTQQVAENGGIIGYVQYASTRPFDSAEQMIRQPWTPGVPHVTINLYQEGFAPDGVTPTLKLVDTTQTSSWDDWAQGFYPSSTAGSGAGAGQKPYMSCPGQMTTDLFYFTLYGQPEFLDLYNSQHNGGTLHTLPYNSQFKCYDAMHIWNQIQPASYDGHYSFPSSIGIDPTTGKPLAVKGSTSGVVASMNGTNCTICVGNPDTTDHYRTGTPMLPPGKYVVEVVMPPGYEIEKEEDKNLLIGDNYIAPITQEFAGLGGYVFIMPDQASVASLYDPSGAGYNPNNAQNATTSFATGQELSANPGWPGQPEEIWPCVGEQRIVPDYLSLFPQALEVAPFAGATRPLCDRKEVTLNNQMAANAKFYIFTSTHIASKFTGVITDDFTSEFDPFSPQFGEKFAPPNLPVSTRDYLGNEISRVYSDNFGIFNGLTYSSWEVNPPNITGYSPTMMVQCMNDPGPIPNGSGGTKNDPLYNPAYSDFCYELPYMPGTTSYLDTPVVPTQAFVGAGYNNPDCSYPDATPAIAEVDGDGVGPYVSAAGHTLTITALGNVTATNGSGGVTNAAYAGPSANVAPFNDKTVTRHFGFGTQCSSPTPANATCNTLSSVTIGGVAATIGTWSDATVTVTVPSTVPACPIQQQAQYGGSAALCGQLVITAGNGQKSVDAVTVTVGGKAPVHVNATDTIQSKIDAAAPGDLIIVDPLCSSGSVTVPCTTAGAVKSIASHTEMLIMWKPVRLQGVGAASVVINANTQPAGTLLDPWRRHINCLFGLTLQGVPYGTSSPYDPTGMYSCPDTGWNYFTAQPNVPQVDRLPLEATVGWDATLNGNLAELLQEPTLMGAYEGAGITVLGKGLDFHGQDPWNDANEAGAFPVGTTLLTGVVSHPERATGSTGALVLGDNNPLCKDGTSGANRFPSNFICNPSSIDGLTVTNSSQGGGGIFVHGWAHYLQIANDRVYNNAGTLSGGISVGQGEFAPPYIVGSATNAAPGSCSDGTGFVTNQHLPMCLQLDVNVHNNAITDNSSIGDELFSATLSGGGGATISTGNEYYKFRNNWVCGNVSAGEGGGMVHLGEIFNGDIEYNSFIFNESSNPTIPTNGGGIMVQGTPDTDPVCGTLSDQDCPPGLSDGTGPGLVINANLIQGNSADSGSGGGIRLQQVNGTEVATFAHQPQYWHDVTITNNIIVNNLAGWDGAGISLQDALNVNIINNTIAHNDSLASSGVLTNSIGTPLSSAPAGNCTNAAGTASCPQVAGVASTQHSALLATTFTGLTLTCPAGHSNCQGFSNPVLDNNIIWQNRSFYIGVGTRGSGTLNQQNLVSLFDAFTTTLAPTQTATGQCSTFPTGSYWDIGVRGDTTTSPNSGSGFSLNPMYSVLTSISGYSAAGLHNLGSDPAVAAEYCNGSRVPPECTVADGCGGLNGFGVPPGINDAVVPNPVFSLTPSATVDEGNNWINVSWGPLSLTNPAVTGGANGNYGGGAPLGNYVPTSSSPTIDIIPTASANLALAPAALSHDFFGNPRPDPANLNAVDIGAVEFQIGGVGTAVVAVTPTSLSFGSVTVGATSTAQTLTLNNTGSAAFTGISVVITSPFARAAAGGTCTTSLAAGSSCTINVVFSPTAGVASLGTATITGSVTVTGSPVSLTGTGVVLTVSASLTPATWTVSQTRNCPGIGKGGVAACAADPSRVFTLTNTGTLPLTGITQGVLGGANTADYAIVGSLSTCGPAGGSQLTSTTTLAPGATCVVTVQFQPLTSEAAGTKSATISVTDSAGTQTSNLNGTAN